MITTCYRKSGIFDGCQFTDMQKILVCSHYVTKRGCAIPSQDTERPCVLWGTHFASRATKFEVE